MKVENIVAVTGTYKNKQGEEKKNYVTVGKLLTNEEKGIVSVKMECIPVWWDGRANVYPIKEKEGSSFNSDPTGDLPF